MKQFLIDLGLVIFLLCVMSLFFGNHQVSQTLFERSVHQFEENVDTEQVTQSSVTLQDTSDNHISTFFKSVSQKCVEIIEFIALIFSDFVSMILCVVVY
jgi:hypothetical protein